jgi:thiol-disulfide isomerase/thioredoxin
MSKKMKLTLYHADWCGHCVKFLPEWYKFKNTFKNKHSGKIDIHDIEAANVTTNVTIAGKQLEGYPTVKVEYDGQEFEYKGKRTFEGLTDFVTHRLKI